MAIDFTLDPLVADVRSRTRAFIDDVVIPAEAGVGPDDHGLPATRLAELRDAARDAGVFAPTAPVEYGGLGLDHRAQAVVLEEAGRSVLGPIALNCAAPDEGNILLLHKKATDAQHERYTAPLARGQVRSGFAMTEPAPGAGADPNQLRTVATQVDGGWRIDGRKWLITGAEGAAFFIVMARTGNDGASMFLVDAGTPGLDLVRTVHTLDSAFAGGHGELLFTGCTVPPDAVLGTVHDGFAAAQVRLGPARLTHCMRWLGAARRAHEEAVRYASERAMFGGVLGDLGMAQRHIAENELDIAASRGLILQAAWALDNGRPARQETSVAKAFVAEAVHRVVDRSMQLCGGHGMSYDSPLPSLLREIRPFRVYDGPTEVHLQAIARRALRRSRSGELPGDWT
jgi:alkylation response protein AidB-like acyl-CoA dehydrogenase